MEMFNFVLDSFKRGIFDFKVKRQDLIAGTVSIKSIKKAEENCQVAQKSVFKV